MLKPAFQIFAFNLILVVACPVSPAWGQARSVIQNGNVSHFENGNEGFTEPVETIHVAAPEAGIVRVVECKLGDRVEQGQLLVQMDTTVLEASRKIAVAKSTSNAKLNAATVEFETKKSRYQKLIELVKDRAGTPEEVERARADAEVARQNIQAATEELELNRLELSRIDAQLEKRRVRSPISGYVVDLKKKPGEYVSANEPQIATVVRLDTLRVIFHVPTQFASELKPNNDLKIYFPESNQSAKGAIEYIAPITSADSGRVQVDVLIDNSRGQYRSGVRCKLVGQSYRSASSILTRTGN